jgi:hypothetical protein
MGLFDFWRQDKSVSTDIVERSDEEEDKESKTKIGAGIALDRSVRESAAQAKAKYARPDYNPQTRKAYYDDGSAHKNALDNAFSDGKTVRDPYSGAELVKKQSDAKQQFGEDWQNHAAEADHIDPLSQITKRTKKNPFLTTEDVKEIGNSEDNFQVLSRKLNQGSKEVGKGGSTQAEWADDTARMDGLSENIESGENIDVVSRRIKETGKAAEKRNNRRAFKRGFKNAAGTAHEAGRAGAQNAGVTALTMSGITNLVSVINGEKSGEDALADTIKDGGKAAVTGYAMGGGMTVLAQTLSTSSSEFVQALAKSNVPGKVITAVMTTGDTLKKWGNGEITTQECMIQLGEKGLNMATMGYSMAVGQALIPIPIVGGAVGAVVGSMLTSGLYNGLMKELQTKQLEHNERMRIIAECDAAAEQMRAYRAELERYLDSYFQDYRSCFDAALSSMQLSYQIGDADGVIAGANEITRKLGGKVHYETVEQFKSFLDEDSIDIL